MHCHLLRDLQLPFLLVGMQVNTDTFDRESVRICIADYIYFQSSESCRVNWRFKKTRADRRWQLAYFEETLPNSQKKMIWL